MRSGEDLSQDCSETVRRTNPNRGGFIGPRCHEVVFAREPDVLSTRCRHGGDGLGMSLATIIEAIAIVRLLRSGGADSKGMGSPNTTQYSPNQSQIAKRRNFLIKEDLGVVFGAWKRKNKPNGRRVDAIWRSILEKKSSELDGFRPSCHLPPHGGSMSDPHSCSGSAYSGQSPNRHGRGGRQGCIQFCSRSRSGTSRFMLTA
jgi:hypothetical protein